MTLDRILEVVGTLLDFADNRARALSVAAGAGIATLAAWWFALARAIPDVAPQAEAYALAVAAVFAPFVAVNAAWQAVSPQAGVDDADEGSGPLSTSRSRSAEERRRRGSLIAAVAGVLNGLAIYIATH